MNRAMRDGVRANCAENGIGWARATIGTWSDGEVDIFVREWVNDFDRIEADEHEKERNRLSKAALDAAQLSAKTSRESAEASRSSARWTMWAAIAAAISATIPLAQAYHLLPK